MLTRWFSNVLLAIDELGNAILGGAADETLSSRLGRIKVRGHGRIPWTRPLAKIADSLLSCIDPGHTIDAILPTRGDQGLIDRPPGVKCACGHRASLHDPATGHCRECHCLYFFPHPPPR